MSEFEEAKQKARELDKLHPNIRHFVGINYGIVRVRRAMKYKVEGESSDGNYLDGQSFDTEQAFDTEQEANQEVWMLSQEFPENSYWVGVE